MPSYISCFNKCSVASKPKSKSCCSKCTEKAKSVSCCRHHKCSEQPKSCCNKSKSIVSVASCQLKQHAMHHKDHVISCVQAARGKCCKYKKTTCRDDCKRVGCQKTQTDVKVSVCTNGKCTKSHKKATSEATAASFPFNGAPTSDDYYGCCCKIGICTPGRLGGKCSRGCSCSTTLTTTTTSTTSSMPGIAASAHHTHAAVSSHHTPLQHVASVAGAANENSVVDTSEASIVDFTEHKGRNDCAKSTAGSKCAKTCCNIQVNTPTCIGNPCTMPVCKNVCAVRKPSPAPQVHAPVCKVQVAYNCYCSPAHVQPVYVPACNEWCW